MKVRANCEYIYYPNTLDRCDGRTSLIPGNIVRVVDLLGWPQANIMNHCYVTLNGVFAGLVHCNSLHSKRDKALIVAAIKRDMERLKQQSGECPECGADIPIREISLPCAECGTLPPKGE